MLEGLVKTYKNLFAEYSQLASREEALLGKDEVSVEFDYA